MSERTTGRAALGALAFVTLTVALSWTIWTLTWLAVGRPAAIVESAAMVVAVYAGSFAPGVAAAALSLMAGRGSLRTWLGAFVRFRCGWRAYAAALLPLPLVVLALTFALGYVPKPASQHGLPPILFYLTLFPVSIFNGLATTVLGAGPLGEEGGWRGYLLPRLLERGGEARASLIVGIVWALWHAPLMAMFADWRGHVPLAIYLPLYAAGVIGLSFVMTRVWRIGGGSLVPCIWLHGLVNAVGGVAFEHSIWASRWSPEASTGHFALATAITAGLLLWRRHNKRGG